MAQAGFSTFSSSFWADADDRRWLGLLAASLALLLGIRIIALLLNQTDLFFDEAQYWAWSEEPAFGYYSKPPLIAWIIGSVTALCGDGSVCVRLASPLLHTLTALTVAALGWRLYDARVGALAGLTYALLPAVSLSSGIISTDVPLLLCWAAALILFWTIIRDQSRSYLPALLLGLVFGVGLNAKYAMAWFVMCAGIYLLVTPSARRAVADFRLPLAASVGLAMLVPNIAWNGQNRFATLSHTADNANW
ncbi:MAG: glycosyltransferase family 39 protein, partial [Pseudomonadota bacterium]